MESIFLNLKKHLKNYDYNQLIEKNKIKFFQIRLLVEFILKSLVSKNRKMNIPLNKTMISNCVINEYSSDLSNNVSCINLSDKILISRKKFEKDGNISFIDTIYDLPDDIIELIQVTHSNFLFTDNNNNEYPLYYKNSVKRFNKFETDYLKLIITYLKKFNFDEEEIFKISTKNMNELLSFNVHKISQEKTTTHLNVLQWQELFQRGVERKDCVCGAYGVYVYQRVVIENKDLKGLRPIHDPSCNKILN